MYSIKSFSFIKVPGNAGLLLLTVLTPPTRGLTVAIPTVNLVDWITSALNVLIPTDESDPSYPTIP